MIDRSAQELARAKKLRRGFPLAGAAEAATVRVRNGHPEGERGRVAKRYPHARWGAVEVREVLFFDRA